MWLKTTCTIFCVLLSSVLVRAQNDTLFNQTDSQGLKQGFWRKHYPNGNVMYEGQFKDGKPVEELRRYYESGDLRVIMNYKKNSRPVYTRFYYDDGEIAAEGLYLDKKKDSLWKYYSFYTGALTSTENYILGEKSGMEKKYYSNGQISEEIEWENNARHGVWNQYFENGKPKLKAGYSFNAVNGAYTFYWPNGNVLIMGHYVDNKRHGHWTFFTDDGKIKSEIDYYYGQAKKEKEMIEKDQEFFKMIEDNMGKFQEPTIDDLMPGSRY